MLGLITLPLTAQDGLRPSGYASTRQAPAVTRAGSAQAPSATVDIEAAPARVADVADAAVEVPTRPEPAAPPARVEPLEAPLPHSLAADNSLAPAATAPVAADMAPLLAVPVTIAAPAPSPAPLEVPARPAAPTLSGREQRLLDAINAQRTGAGLPPLSANPTLTQAARTRSEDMAVNGYFAHISPRGQSWYTALAAVGWTMSGGGENLAKVAGDESTSVAVAVDRLMASPSHRANIVNQAFHLVGIGAVVDAAGNTIFTTIFTDR